MSQELFKKRSIPPEMRARDLLSRMTLEEKLAQLGAVWGYELLEEGRFSQEKAKELIPHGIGSLTRPAGSTGLQPEEVAEFVNLVQRFLLEETRLGIPALVHEECLSGVLSRRATLFPQPIALASTWMPELARQMAELIREQMLALGAREGLAPVLDVARDPRWGRVEETFGEDPYLVAAMGAAYVEGLQGDDPREGVAATLKHFAGYGASEGGLNCAPAHLPERELREVYLFPFECAIGEAGALAVMHSYGELDGVPCAASRWLLTSVLRGEWGFSGITVSDYFGIEMLHSYHRLARDKAEAARLALEAGVDLELPRTNCYGQPLKKAVEGGLVPEALIDRAVLRVLHLKFSLGLFEAPYVDLKLTRKVFSTADRAKGRDLAKLISQKSVVLLKNEGLLPLKQDISSIAVIGPHADAPRNYLGDYHFPAHGEGQLEGVEEALEELGITTLLGAVRSRVSAGTRVLYARGCDVLGGDKGGISEAVRVAREAEVVVIAVGDRSGLGQNSSSGESRDVAGLRLPGVEELVKAVAETGTPVVLVLFCGRPYLLTPLVEKVKAALVAWLPGEAGGEAVCEVLFGDKAPGGKLPMSFPKSTGQLPLFYARKPSGGRSYPWGGYVDESPDPLFPFGHGLSYTQFSYHDLRIEPGEVPTDGTARVSLKIENCGHREGEEVAQLYISRAWGSVTRPVKELRGFLRLSLRPGEEKQVTFEIPVDVLAYWDREMNLVVEPGDYQVMVGGSSADIRLSGVLRVVGERRPVGGRRRCLSRAKEGGPEP
ncbi:MAG: Beta-mannanase [Acetothermia bacterium 64_32]|nr:MAG: Beta-mannanase [Acetothermia bacterium 64_32]HAF70205.1 beta-glucosidase [Candidatus Acetothermia bacterium]